MTASLDLSTEPNRLLAVVAQVAREARPNVTAHVTLDSSLERDLGLDSLARVELVPDELLPQAASSRARPQSMTTRASTRLWSSRNATAGSSPSWASDSGRSIPCSCNGR